MSPCERSSRMVASWSIVEGCRLEPVRSRRGGGGLSFRALRPCPRESEPPSTPGLGRRSGGAASHDLDVASPAFGAYTR